MPLSPTVRRLAIVVGVLFILFLFLRPSSSSSPAFTPPSHDAHGSSADVPTRPYPPPTQPKEQEIAIEHDTKPIRERLRYHFPYDLKSKFPAYIWQTWKYSPAMGEFSDRLRPMEASWTEKNAGFVHEVITDDAAAHLISYLYSSIPEVLQAYEAMPLPVLKADFFRYLILLARGGIYSDIDTEALKPAIEWLPSDFDRTTVGLIVGIEADPDRPDWAEWYARRIQFCQWTMQSKPGHPVLRDLVATITENTLDMKRQNKLVKGKDPPTSIMEFTGPGVWTDAIFSYFNNQEYFDFSRRKSNVSYPDFFNLREQKMMGDVVVLPITSFSPGVGQMGAEGTDHPLAFVKHEFDGSWKPESERMNG